MVLDTHRIGAQALIDHDAGGLGAHLGLAFIQQAGGS
jgi:hypothetical protein